MNYLRRNNGGQGTGLWDGLGIKLQMLKNNKMKNYEKMDKLRTSSPTIATPMFNLIHLRREIQTSVYCLLFNDLNFLMMKNNTAAAEDALVKLHQVMNVDNYSVRSMGNYFRELRFIFGYYPLTVQHPTCRMVNPTQPD